MQLLNATFPMLERGKHYELAAVVLTSIISQTHFQVHGWWYQRLAMNLKHLKLKYEAYQLTNGVLSQVKVLKLFERNGLLKIKLALYCDLLRAELRSIKRPKARKKPKKAV